MIADKEFKTLLDRINTLENQVRILKKDTSLANTYKPFFIAKITGHTTIASNKYSYAYVTVNYENNAWVNTAYTGTAYNLIEANNSGTGVLGNGVDITHVANTFTMQPVPINTYIQVFSYGGKNWFSYENAIDGVCS